MLSSSALFLYLTEVHIVELAVKRRRRVRLLVVHHVDNLILLHCSSLLKLPRMIILK